MLSILIPAFNEEGAIQETITRIQETMDNSGIVYEVIVVNDGSSDNTAQVVTDMGIQVINHPTNGGYGLALKTGLKYAQFDWCCIIDADGTYPVSSLPDLIQYIPEFDMVVGARTGSHYWGSLSKRVGRLALLKMIAFVIGTSIPDANSGMRIFRVSIARQHIQRISSGFSFTTTLTLAMFMEHHFVKYVPIEYYDRVGSSKVKIRIDSLRMLQILVMTILYYNPLKLFLLVCMTTVSIGLIAGIWGVIGDNPFGIPLMLMSIFVSFIIGSLGFVAEALRLHRISNSIPTEVDKHLTINE